NECSRLGEAPEPVEIQAVIAELAVEARARGMLRRLAGFDAIEGDAMSRGPGVQRLASKLRPVVASDLLGRAKPAEELVKDAGRGLARQGGVHFSGQRGGSDEVEHVERREASASAEHSWHEDHDPHLCLFPGPLLYATRLRLRRHSANCSSRESRETACD